MVSCMHGSSYVISLPVLVPCINTSYTHSLLSTMWIDPFNTWHFFILSSFSLAKQHRHEIFTKSTDGTGPIRSFQTCKQFFFSYAGLLIIGIVMLILLGSTLVSIVSIHHSCCKNGCLHTTRKTTLTVLIGIPALCWFYYLSMGSDGVNLSCSGKVVKHCNLTDSWGAENMI